MDKHEKYINKKLMDITNEVCVVSAIAGMLALMHGKITDGAIQQRDESNTKIKKMVRQVIKRINKGTQNPNNNNKGKEDIK